MVNIQKDIKSEDASCLQGESPVLFVDWVSLNKCEHLRFFRVLMIPAPQLRKLVILVGIFFLCLPVFPFTKLKVNVSCRMFQAHLKLCLSQLLGWRCCNAHMRRTANLPNAIASSYRSSARLGCLESFQPLWVLCQWKLTIKWMLKYFYLMNKMNISLFGARCVQKKVSADQDEP